MTTPPHRRRLIALLCAFVALLCALPLRAQRVDCPSGNLLAGLQPVEWLDIYHVERLTDGLVSPEGAAWNAETNSPATPYGYAIFDLGAQRRLGAFYLQGEGLGSYEMAISDDASAWTTLPSVPPTGGAGMRERYAQGLDIRGRYLRLATADTNALYAIGEFAAWCEAPSAWPPQFVERDGLVRDDAWAKERERRLHLAKLALLLGAGVLLLLARRVPRAATALYAGVAVAGALAWINFGSFHGPNLTHYHDTYHYLVGANYFDENEYDGLYACTAWAEAELGLGDSVRNRYINDLANNELVAGANYLESAPPCRARFSDARWEAFREDIRFFRNNLYPGSWQRIFRDHGYNPTPVWTLLGKTLARGGPASDVVPRLVWIDLLLWIGIGACVLWAFGWESLALVFLTLGTGLPWEYFWNGGAFARIPWLFCLVAGVCLLKKERPLLGGFALGLPVLLRVFPAVFWIGPLIVLVARLLKKRDARPLLRIAAGGLLAVALLVPLSIAATGSASWPAFAHNFKKYASMTSGNQMGLPALLSFSPQQTQGRLLTQQIESLDDWREARAATLRARAIPYWALTLALGAWCGWTLLRRRWEPWEWVLAGCVFAVLLGQLNSYYYAFLILLAAWAYGSLRRVVLLLAALALSQALGLFDLGTDVRFFWASLVFVSLPLVLWWDQSRGRELLS